MNFNEMLADRVCLYDGSKGFLLIRKGLAAGECPDMWNISRADVIYDIHKAYVDAGSEVIQTNTLQSDRFHLEQWGLYNKLEEINSSGVSIAKKAANGRALVAASIAPLGKLMAPFGDLNFNEATEAFSERVGILLDAGVDILHFETFTDLSELRAAIIAAKGIDCAKPIIATLSIENNGHTIMGDDMECAAAALTALGVDCAGLNCGMSPREMLSVFEPFKSFGAPLCSKPNAGAPVMSDGVLSYNATEDEFYETAFGFAGYGARLIGGCCGSGPSHIAKLRIAVDAINSDAKYRYAIQSGDADAFTPRGGDGDRTIKLCSFSKTEYVTYNDITACVNEYNKRLLTRSINGEDEPEIISLGGKSIVFTDFSSLLSKQKTDEDDIIEIMAGAETSDADTAVFRLFTGRGNADETAGGAAADILSQVAINARTYYKKPILFYSNNAPALKKAIERYCGAPAVIADEKLYDQTAAALKGYNTTIVKC